VTPSVSVVIPAFNAERFLGDALDSVARQTLRPLECIVVDDGSSDNTQVIANQHPACTECVTQPNRGVSAARNAGATRAQAPLLAFLDADDAWLPTRLERMTQRMLRERAQAALCATWLADGALNPQTRLSISADLSPERMLLRQVTLVSSSSSLLIEREAFNTVGGFNESFSTSADWYLTFRLVGELEWAYEPEALVLYRRHPGGMSRNVDRMASDMLRIYREIFASASSGRLPGRRKAFGSLHRMLAASYFVSGRTGAGARHAVTSMILTPTAVFYFAGAIARYLVSDRHG
jgi:glycosyltransferase involved in cell wall biosynthesis